MTRATPPPGTFAALADPTRRAILRRLSGGSKTAGEIAATFELSRPTLSHHFRVLEEAGLIRSERRGTRIVYTLQTGALEDLAAELMDIAQSAAQLARRRKARSS